MNHIYVCTLPVTQFEHGAPPAQMLRSPGAFRSHLHSNAHHASAQSRNRHVRGEFAAPTAKRQQATVPPRWLSSGGSYLYGTATRTDATMTLSSILRV